MVVRSCHRPSEPGENRTGDRRKGSENTTTTCSNRDIIYIRWLEESVTKLTDRTDTTAVTPLYSLAVRGGGVEFRNVISRVSKTRGPGRCLSLTYLRTEQELRRVRSSRAVCWRNFVERCRRIYGEPRYEEWHQSLSHDVAYTDGLRPEGWFRPEWISSNYSPEFIMEKVLRPAFLDCISQITLVVAPLRNNLGGVTVRQTCADSACYQMVIKYVKVKTNTWNDASVSMVITK